MLLTATELHARLNDPATVIFDCRHDLIDHQRGARAYAESHVPGAHFAAVETDLSGAKTGSNGRHPLPEARALAAFLGARGVSPATTVVAYDDAGGAYAIRLWWLARWIGHTQVLVLDGGWKAWQARGLPTHTEVPAPARLAVPYPVQPDAMPVVNAADVRANLVTRRFALIDARAPQRYRGEQEPIDPVAGHIPGATNHFHQTNLDAGLTFRAAPELRREYLALLDGRSATDIVHYCGSGITASVNLFAMELAGLKGSRLYAGSWSEWCSDPSRPVATASVPPPPSDGVGPTAP